MTRQDLPNRGPEREIFVRALSRFSNDCHPPELNADCPFLEGSPAGAVCGEQCKDILGEVGGDQPTHSIGLPFGDGFVLHRRPRPRPRRGPDRAKRPFDAREAYLSDRDRPRDSRSAASLIHELRILLFEHPDAADDPQEKRYEIRASFDELARRGVDAEALVRHGLLDQFALGIPMLAALPEFGVSVDGHRAELGQAWHELLVASHEVDRARSLHRFTDLNALMSRVRSMALSFDVLPPLNAPGTSGTAVRESTNEELTGYALSGRFVNRVISWVQTADLDEVLDWQAPLAETFVDELMSVGPAPVDVEAGSWLFDRFSKTYLADWEPASLKLEWQWLHGRCVGAAPAGVMKERPTRAEEVAACLADLAAMPAGAPVPDAVPSEGDDSVALYKFVYLAARSLREGRRQEAIALYRGLAQLKPQDPDINNNYGFCLLVDEPESAVQWLERAAVLAAGTLDATNMANRIYAATLLNNDGHALELAESLYEASLTGGFPSAFLWLNDGSGPVLGENIDPLVYSAELAHGAATRLNRSDLVTQWTSRIAQLTAGPV